MSKLNNIVGQKAFIEQIVVILHRFSNNLINMKEAFEKIDSVEFQFNDESIKTDMYNIISEIDGFPSRYHALQELLKKNPTEAELTLFLRP